MLYPDHVTKRQRFSYDSNSWYKGYFNKYRSLYDDSIYNCNTVTEQINPFKE